MPRQAPAAATGRLVFQLKAHGQEEGEHALEKRLPIAKQLTVGRFVLKIDSDGAVFTGRVGCSSHGHPQVRWSMQLVTKDEGNASQFQEDPQRRRGFTTKVGGMWLFQDGTHARLGDWSVYESV